MSVNATAPKIIVFKPTGERALAFSSRAWENPLAEGKRARIKTIAAHAGMHAARELNAASMPIFTTSTSPAPSAEELGARFQDYPAARSGLIYSRLGNPTTYALETALAEMSGCENAMVFGSGMAAISHAVLLLAEAGSNIVSHKTVYGCTDDLLTHQLPGLGIETRFADLRDPQMLKQAIDSGTRLVFLETPSNPSLDLINIRRVAEIANGRCPIIVDNTFASPMGQNPFDFGADVVIYSMTKSIGGHTNAIGGAVLGSNALLQYLFSTRNDFGGMLSPREADAFLNGMKTLPVRYAQMEENAKVLAQLLTWSPQIQSVHYPLLDPSYPLGGQMKGPGYMIAFILKKGLEGGKTLINSLQLITNAVSLGSVESLICHPASTTHGRIPPEERQAKGIDDGLIRLSVGTEDVHDLSEDLKQALAKVGQL